MLRAQERASREAELRRGDQQADFPRRTDDKRIFAVKNERLVSSQQLYGVIDDPSIVLPFFTADYLANNIPSLESEGSPVAGRTRYVWAIEPRLNKDGTRMVEGKRAEGMKHDLDANGYIGNIVYELHPKWGLMTEAIKAVIPFVFMTLKLPRIIIDPVASKEASLALAEKLGFTRIGAVDRKTVSFFKHSKQIRYELTREQWLKTKKPSKPKAKKKRKKGAATDAAGETAVAQVELVAPPKETGTEAGAEDAKKAAKEDAGEKDSANVAANGAEQTDDGAAAANGGESITPTRRTCRWCAAPRFSIMNGKLIRTLQGPSAVASGRPRVRGLQMGLLVLTTLKTAELTYHNGAHYLQCPGKGGKVEAR
ncbi:hypothetical protein JCM10295v2_003391 [Rhodotorula toruloides]